MSEKIDVLFLCELNTDDKSLLLDRWSKLDMVRQLLFCESPVGSVASLQSVVADLKSPYVLLVESGLNMKAAYRMLERMQAVLRSTGASMVYADYLEEKEGKQRPNKLIDYQEGSLRNDFNFGPAILTPLNLLLEWVAWEKGTYKFAGLYSYRLFASRKGAIIHIPEMLSLMTEADTRTSGEKQFDYVRKEAQLQQKEMEEVCTVHLKAIDAFVQMPRGQLDFSASFPVEATVVIPVKNRSKTINDAIHSVLSQSCKHTFNLIVVDNHSTDGTSDIIERFADDPRLIHLQPERNDLGIGGCWSEALHHPACGKFLIQLDSDDVYKNENTIQLILDTFYQENCAMVVGAYEMVDINLKPIPPFVVDHREWTKENGANNALRINGLGAPRAFFTPILKEIGIPNVSYGEDYALGITLSGLYRIGRIYDPIYLCRRWDGNSDASLDNVSVNAHNHYKDMLRTIEIKARQKRNMCD